MSSTIDLSQDLAEAARWSTSLEQIDRLLIEALEALGNIVPFDLATIMELQDGELAVRVASGSLDEPAVRNHRLLLTEFPSLQEVISAGEAHAFAEHDHAEGDGDPFDGVLDLPHGHSCMVVPLKDGAAPIGLMTIDRSTCGEYGDDVVQLAGVVGKLLAQVLNHGEQSMRLDRLLAQVREQNRLLRENHEKGACQLIGQSLSPAMKHAGRLAQQVAATQAPVLLTGETGTGKSVMAEAIHGWSSRADKPFISLNCAALPASLIESELFGHIQGAFSGATKDRIGRFQAANGGTLFLDEIGEIPADLQAKLLRVLQDGCFEPVGSDVTVRVDVRIIAATNRDLLQDTQSGRFREDLYYRLAVFPITMPPLRARLEDIEVIANQHLRQVALRHGKPPTDLSDFELQRLQAYHWPGNVRELLNLLERGVILATQDGLEIELPANVATAAPAPQPSGSFRKLVDVEKQHIRDALTRTDGQVHGKSGAARLLGIHPNTLLSRMKKHGLGGARDNRN